MHAREGATRTRQSSGLGQKTVGTLDSVGNKRLVLLYDMQNTFVSVLLDQLEDLGTNAKVHCRRLRPRQYSAIPQIES